MKAYKEAKWIWNEQSLNKIDDYVSFTQNFETNKKELLLRISCDSIYAVYLNNVLIKFMQCSDFPHYKYFDEIKIGNLNRINNLRIDVWHLGVESQNYYVDSAGLIFEVLDGNEVVCFSNENTNSRIINQFTNGLVKTITSQLGLSFEYDANIPDSEFSNSVVVNKRYDSFVKREINNIVLESKTDFKILRTCPSILIDLGKEIAGIVEMDFVSPIKQKLTISYGEHIKDGKVRRIIGERDFSFVYIAKEGQNNFINPLRRIAGRYLEITYENPINIKYFGINATNYKHNIIPKKFDDKLLQEIYDKCVYTIECCMHEHYEDCPWREQCLYSLDSRNQMLCGYYAFEGFEYQKHNLLLIANDPMSLGLLALCYPSSKTGLAIPMFSLTYIIQVCEYIEHTGDITNLNEVQSTLNKIINAFQARIDDTNLIKYFPKPFWNFYEWTEGSEGTEAFVPSSPVEINQYDLIINCMYVYAIEMYCKVAEIHIDTNSIKESIVHTFYNPIDHLFKINTNNDKYSQFGNALALLIGLGDKTTANKVKNCEDMIEASLSVRGFVYDALLESKENKEFIINDIRNRYKKMIDDGATTFYETEDGASAFDNAGSLCHGWSSLPIYYLNKLGE